MSITDEAVEAAARAWLASAYNVDIADTARNEKTLIWRSSIREARAALTAAIPFLTETKIMTGLQDTSSATAADVRMLWEAIDSLRARVAELEDDAETDFGPLIRRSRRERAGILKHITRSGTVNGDDDA